MADYRQESVNLYLKEVNSVFSQYETAQTKDIWLSNKEAIELLYNYISQYHNIAQNNKSTLEKIAMIEQYLNIDGLLSTYSETRRYFQGHSYRDVCNTYDAFQYEYKRELAKQYSIKNSGYNNVIVEKLCSIDDRLKNQITGKTGVPFMDIIKGVKTEENVYVQLKSYLRDGYTIINGYRHKTELGDVSSSENDILVICRKGIFTIEIKSASQQSATIQSSGVLLYGNTVAESNPVEQCIKHKLYLNGLLEGTFPSIKNHIVPIIYLENVSAIDNQFPSVEAYNKIAILADAISKREDVFSFGQFRDIVNFLNDKALPEMKLKYTVTGSNPYANVLEYRKGMLKALEILEKRAIGEKQWEKKKKIIDGVITLVCSLLLATLMFVLLKCLNLCNLLVNIQEAMQIAYTYYGGMKGVDPAITVMLAECTFVLALGLIVSVFVWLVLTYLLKLFKVEKRPSFLYSYLLTIIAVALQAFIQYYQTTGVFPWIFQ